MNRQIKFRAKRLDNGEWVEGDLGSSNKYHGTVILKKGQVMYHEVDADTVCQYTGHKDDFDKEIYEGDIIDNDRGEFVLVKWTVWDDVQGFMLDLDSPLKIVGNKWDNPEIKHYEHTDSLTLNINHATNNNRAMQGGDDRMASLLRERESGYNHHTRQFN